MLAAALRAVRRGRGPRRSTGTGAAREDAAAAISDAAASETTTAEPSAVGAAWWTRAGELAWERGEAAESLRYFAAARG